MVAQTVPLKAFCGHICWACYVIGLGPKFNLYQIHCWKIMNIKSLERYTIENIEGRQYIFLGLKVKGDKK